MFRFLLIIFILIISSCDQNDNKIKQDFDRTGHPQKITVFVYTTKYDMQRAKAILMEEAIEDRIQGWSKWTNRPEDGCEIHVLKASALQTATWGHELMHCMYGMFHKEVS